MGGGGNFTPFGQKGSKMPFYDFNCPEGHRFTQRAGYDTNKVKCACGKQAKRAFVSLSNFRVGETAAPEGTPEWDEQEKRKWAGKGWDYSRALETISKAQFEDRDGNKRIDGTKLPKE